MIEKIKNLIMPSWYISKKKMEYYYIEDKLKETNKLVSGLEKEKNKLEEKNQMLLHNLVENGVNGLNRYYYVDETFRIEQSYTHHIERDYRKITNRLGLTKTRKKYKLVEKNEERYIFKGTQRECECYIKEVRENLDIKE